MTNFLTIKTKPREPSRGLVHGFGMTLPCALGRSGMRSQKCEGDGATPILVTRPLYGFYRADRERKPVSSLPFYPMARHWGWCDDPTHPSYNRLVDRPFASSHEEMWREDNLYDLVIVLDINISKRIRGRGSALFMHVARPDYKATEGCIALAKPDLRKLLKLMGHDCRINIQH